MQSTWRRPDTNQHAFLTYPMRNGLATSFDSVSEERDGDMDILKWASRKK